MAGGAEASLRCVRAVGGETPSHRPSVSSSGGTDGRRRRRGVEEILENPLAAKHGRGTSGVRGNGENTALGKHATTPIGRAHVDSPEFLTCDTGDSIKPREPLIKKTIVGVKEVEHAAVPANDVLGEELGFAPHGIAKAFIEIRKAFAIGPYDVNIAELKPLASKVLDQGSGFFVLQHAADLRFENRWLTKPMLGRETHKLSVRHVLHRKYDNREAIS